MESTNGITRFSTLTVEQRPLSVFQRQTVGENPEPFSGVGDRFSCSPNFAVPAELQDEVDLLAERSYFALGRQSAAGSRLGEDVAYPAPLIAAAQAGIMTGMAAGYRMLAQPVLATVGSSPEPESAVRSTPDGGNERADVRTANSGGLEARAAERTFIGSSSAAKHPDDGKEKAHGENKSKSPNALSEKEQKEVAELQARDREVRSHEQAHMSAGGGLVGGATYETTQGPDGKFYAVAGEVPIDTSEASSPKATITKAQKIRAAALAPAQPSSQDHAVAARASQMEAKARQEQMATDEDAIVLENGHSAGSEQARLQRAAKTYQRTSEALPPVSYGNAASLAV